MNNSDKFRTFSHAVEGNKKTRLASSIWVLLILITFSIYSHAQQFTVYQEWDFENMTKGVCNEDTLYKYFKHSEPPVYYPNEELVHIVTDTINGEATQVMRMKQRPNELYHGFGMRIWLTEDRTDFDEVYLTYNWKFSEEYNSTAGGKIPGFNGTPRDPGQGPDCPDPGYGFSAIMIYKRAGQLVSYYYDRTSHGYATCPWANEKYKFNQIYLSNGSWYNITQRLVMNTFTDGVANADGLKETWVDGRLLLRESNLKLMVDEADSMKIDVFRMANFYGGSDEKYMPMTECWGYLDNVTVWTPADDSIAGNTAHANSTVLPTPDEITDRLVYYDSLITSEGNFSNTEYGNTYSACIDETYLIDAGEGNKVTVEITGGGLGVGDYLLFYDGNTTDAELIQLVEGAAAGTRQSSGRYMFVRFSTDRLQTGSGWSGTISFSPATSILEKKTGNDSSNRIQIIPNPGENMVTIRGIGQNEAELSVYDLLGRLVIHKKSVSNNSLLDISKLKKGIYNVLVSDGNTYASKFIKD